MCCLQEVRWRGQDARMLGMKGRRCKMWCSGKGDGVDGVGVIGKEVLCGQVALVRMVSDRMMIFVVFEWDVLRLICVVDFVQSGRNLEEKQSFHDELKGEWDMHSVGDLVICFGDHIGHVGWHIDGFDGFL